MDRAPLYKISDKTSQGFKKLPKQVTSLEAFFFFHRVAALTRLEMDRLFGEDRDLYLNVIPDKLYPSEKDLQCSWVYLESSRDNLNRYEVIKGG